MSMEMASSSICVGNSTLPSSHKIVDHTKQQQQVVVVDVKNNSTDASSSIDERNNDESRVTRIVKNDVVPVADMDLVNGPNPWLPAYGFQLQQHSQHFQPTHEDSRTNDPALVQQGDFLETILEETSDDLQSDSDRSGTTYWLGSDSETESVIHIKANQRAAEERPDGSGSECNSVIPKKRRRRNASKDSDTTIATLNDEHWTSPRSSRSSESSSRSSSLLQFESLERTCATVSPSGYSYDSLEYANRSNSNFENTSPDSLEDDDNEDDDDDEDEEIEKRNSRFNGFPSIAKNGFGNLRPYRSFESLDTCHKNDIGIGNELSNGFSSSFYSKTSNDLSAGGFKNVRGHRDFWHETDNDEEEEDYEYEDDEDDDDDDDEDTIVNRESRIYVPYEERNDNVDALNFTDCNLSSYTKSLDFRNTIDLREFGLDAKTENVYDLKTSGQASLLRGLGNTASARLLQTTRLNIAGVEEDCGVSSSFSVNKMASNPLNGSNSSGMLFQHHHHHHHHNNTQQNQRGWNSDESCFNFRFTDKSRSAPSLASQRDHSTTCNSSSSAFARKTRSTNYYPSGCLSTVSSSSLFENYTRVASLPVDLNLCGSDETEDTTTTIETRENDEEDVTITNDNVDEIYRSRHLSNNEMADDSIVSEHSSSDDSTAKSSSVTTDSSMSSTSASSSSSSTRQSDDSFEKIHKNTCVRTSSVRTQIRPEIIEVRTKTDDQACSSVLSSYDNENVAKMNLDADTRKITMDEPNEDAKDTTKATTRTVETPRTTVKTQDRESNVIELAMAMENDIDAVVDEAIRQFKREVEEATGGGANSDNTARLAMEAMQRLTSGKQQQLRHERRIKNNASYELAQQFEIDEMTFPNSEKMSSCAEDEIESQISPGSPGNTTRRRVFNNASYELAQQTDYMKILQNNNTARFKRMNACDERPEFSRRGDVTCGVKVADLVREMSKDTSDQSNVETSVYPGNDEGAQALHVLSDNRVFPGVKNPEASNQQPETMMGQIKKNSDLFLIYGEGGRAGVVAATLGSVERDKNVIDDEVDYQCLEIKSIIDGNDDIDVDEVSRLKLTTMSNDDDDSTRVFTSPGENETFGGLSFIGDFYPETKSHLARGGENLSKDVRECEKIGEIIFDSVADEQGAEESAAEKCKWTNAESVSSSAGKSTSSNDTLERETTVSTIDSLAQEATVTRLLVAEEDVAGLMEGRKAVNDRDAEKEKETKRRRRRKEEYSGYVETGKSSPNRATAATAAASSSNASNPAASSTLLVRTDNRVCFNDADTHEKSGKYIGVKDNNKNNNDEETRKKLVNEEVEKEEEEIESEKNDDITKKSTEMSATAAKRLAMSSEPTTRNNNDASPIKMKNEFAQQKNTINVVNSPVNERKKGGLGGFLQRFSRLRFSGRSKVPRSEITKKMTNDTSTSVVVGSGVNNGGDGDKKRTTGVKIIDEQTRRKKEPDYIIIPLHGPEDNEDGKILAGRDESDGELRNKTRRSTDLERSASCASPNGRPPVSSKPPLPPSHHQYVGGGGGGARNNVATTTPTGRCGSGSTASASTGMIVGNTRRRATTDLGSPAAIEMAKARAMQQAAQEPRPVGLLETDLDAAEPAIRNLGIINGASSSSSTGRNVNITTSNNQAGKKTRSLLNLNHTSGRQGRDVNHHLTNENELRVPHSPGSGNRNNSDHRQDHHNSVGNQRPHKSMEFLLDKENLHFVKPPENELQKVGERVPSEHELRVQRSLQRLNVPDWYKNSPAARDGFRLKRHSDASQHGGWRSLGSKTTSLSSLSSSSNRQPTTGVLLSPSPTPPVFSRWSTSLLNSAGSSPASSARSSFNHRQPYLGWRSQERLANPRTPAERLAQGILPQLQSTKKQQQQQQQTNQQLEVRNSIKEVTSAIVHYVQSGQEVAGGGRLSPRPRPDDWDDRGGARSTSPRGSVKLCWMESSFVGSRPVDSPETPMSLATDTECCAGCNATGTESCSCVDSATSGLYLDLTPTRDEPQQQRQRDIGGQQQQQHGSRSQCPSPSSTLNYHQQIQQHHHHALHQQQQQQQQQQRQQHHQRHHRGSGQSEDDEAMATAALLRNKPSPGSTTLEDVLDSLLGLPSASRTPSPGPGPITGNSSMRHHRASNTVSTSGQTTNTKAGKSCSDLRQDLQESVRGADDDDVSSPVTNEIGRSSSYYVGDLPQRRKSEGSDIVVPPHRSSSRTWSNFRSRRVSFDAAQHNTSATTTTTINNALDNNGAACQIGEKLIRCRNNKCQNATTMIEARRVYKSCHNCTCLYCSRECRRSHWQRHRRTCLHSRAGTLCRQVLSSAKEDSATLKHISALAQRGYTSHGRGAVKCFFTSPEIAEQFVSNGFVDLGEPTYVRWSELLPSEMGAELYAEVMRLCKSYNPETRLVLYVAVCVVSEVPSSGGAVRWERQLVSRCGKIRLDTTCRQTTLPPPAVTCATVAPIVRTAGNTSPCNITREMDSPETLVLTSMGTAGNDGKNTPRSSREIGFTNIQRQLRLRGVSLRRHFPQVYTKLCCYVDGSVDKFAPVTIYPRDQASGKSFMCIIMLDAEPERLQLLPTDSSRVRTVDISVEQE